MTINIFYYFGFTIILIFLFEFIGLIEYMLVVCHAKIQVVFWAYILY